MIMFHTAEAYFISTGNVSVGTCIHVQWTSDVQNVIYAKYAVCISLFVTHTATLTGL